MRHRPSLFLFVTTGMLGIALSACGGSSTAKVTSTSLEPAAETTVAAPSTEVTTTTPATTTPATFDGPSFLEVIDPALAPYNAVLGAAPDSPSVRSVLSALGEDVPLPAGLTVNGVGHQWTLEFGETKDDQTLSFNEFLDGPALEAFGAAVPTGWKQASFATSGSLTTLLITHTDGRRVVLVSDSEAQNPGTGRAPLELQLSTAATPGSTPAWIASLPALAGGELVEYIEASGRIQDNGAGAGQYVLVRWRYPATQLDSLKAYLESGVVQSAGFGYDVDTFNGFESLVAVTIGDWTGSVLIGNASIDGVEYYDLVWSLSLVR